MAIIVGSARGDERGKVKGGKAGDQKQTSSTNDMKGEVSMQNFYVHAKGWRVLRPKKVEHANEIAANMKKACNNPEIGYDQNQRLGTEKHGIDTKTPTETDCSALSRECIEDATGVEIPNYTTENQEKVLEATGLFYEAFTFISLTKTPIYDGDVLVTKVQGHTVIVVSGNPRKANTKPSGTTPSGINKTVLSWQKAAIADGFEFPKYGADGEWGAECESVAEKAIVKMRISNKKHVYRYPNLTKIVQRAVGVTVDGEAGPKTDKAILEYQMRNGLKADGQVGLKTWRKILDV